VAQGSPVTLQEGQFRFGANDKLLSSELFPEWHKVPSLHA